MTTLTGYTYTHFITIHWFFSVYVSSDFGFYRQEGKEDCHRQKDIKAEEIDVCNGKELEKIVTIGWATVVVVIIFVVVVIV